jgi:putative alpha-1,2-mannosidase
MIPSNKTGENPGWTSSEPYYDDIFTFWDTHRCHTALFQILEPAAYEEFIRSLIDIWRHDGFMPDARSSNFNGRVQGGSNADNVLADAYVKGVRGAINWDDGFAAMQVSLSGRARSGMASRIGGTPEAYLNKKASESLTHPIVRCREDAAKQP